MFPCLQASLYTQWKTVLATDTRRFAQKMLSAMPVEEAKPPSLRMIGEELFEPASTFTADHTVGKGGTQVGFVDHLAKLIDI